MEKNKSSLYVGYHVLTNDSIDDRLVLDKSDLSQVNISAIGTDYTATRFPDTYFSIVSDSEHNAQFYVFDKNGTPDSETGLFHLVDYPYILNHPFINSEEVLGRHDGHYYHLQDELIASEGIEIIPGDKNAVIKAVVDDKSVVFDSEGKIAVQAGNALEVSDKKFNVLVDSETVQIVGNMLMVPIDKNTIYVNSEGKISARPEFLRDGLGTHLYYDGDSEVVDVLVDNVTIKIDPATNRLYADAAIEAGNGVELTAGTIPSAKKVNVKGSSTIKVDSEVSVIRDNKTIVVGTKGLEVPIDNSTINVTGGKLVATPGKAGKAITITADTDGKQKIDANVDNITTDINSANNIEVKLNPSGAIVSSTAGIAANVDGTTIKIDGNKITSNLQDGVATKVNTNKVDVLTDNSTIEVASNKLHAKLDPVGGLEVKTNGLGVKVDGATVHINSTGELVSTSANAGRANELTSANVLNVLMDDKTITTNGLNQLYVPIDNKTVVVDSGTVQANIDNKTIEYNTTDGKIEVKTKDGTILKDANGIYVPVDGKTTILDTDGKVKSKIVAKAGITLDTTDGYNNISANVDGTTIKTNTSGQLIRVNELPSYTTGDAYNALRVRADGTLDWQKVSDVYDVKIDGTSIVPTDPFSGLPTGAANIPVATASTLGVVKVAGGTTGVAIDSDDVLYIEAATTGQISGRDAGNYVITPSNLDAAVKAALTDNVGPVYTDLQKYNAQQRLGIGVANFSTWEMTGNKISVSMDSSEFKLTISLLDSEYNVLDAQTVDMPLEEMVIDARYVDTSGGGYIELTLKNGHKILIPLDQLIDGLVTLRTNQDISGSKNFNGGLFQNHLPVISVHNLDGVTLVWDSSEQKAHAVGSVVSEGVATEIIDGGTSSSGNPIRRVNVLYDGKTIITSENKLEVNIDGTTLYYSTSENCIKASGVEVKQGKAITITTDPSSTATKIVNRVDVLTDSESIEVNADNKLAVITDDKTVFIGSEGLELHLDGTTVFLSEGKITAAGLDVSEGDAIEIIESTVAGLPVKTIAVKYDDVTIKLNSEGELKAQGVLPGEAIKFVESEGLQIIDVVRDDITICLDSEHNSLYVPIDNITIKVSEGVLKAAGVEAGVAIELVDSEHTGVNTINALFDDKTIKVAGNKLYVPIDSETIYISSEGLLKAKPEQLKDGVATHIYYDSEFEVVDVIFDSALGLNSEGELIVLYDSETIVLDSEGKLSVAIDDKSLYFNDSERAIKVRPLTEADVLRICQ